MKLTTLMKLCIPAAVMALASVNASAATCANTQSLQDLVNLGAGGCTIGDLTFSNFFFNYTSGHVTGSNSNPSTPDPNNVAVEINQLNDGITGDTFGTIGTATSPVYQVITDYSNIPSDVTVAAFQNEHAYVSYLVTDNTTGTQIVQVDAAIAGTLTAPAMNTLSDKTLCIGGDFTPSGNAPTNNCSTGLLNTAEAVNQTSGGLAFDPVSGQGADSSINYPNFPLPASNRFNGSYGSGASVVGAYDQVDMNGGTDPAGTTTLQAVENDFVVAPQFSTPEPGTIILLGGAFIGFGALRRRKKA